MGVAEKIAEIAATLPPAKQAEVLDFVEFLASRTTGGGVPDPAEWTDTAFQTLALRGLADDDDPVRYDLSDCKETR
jgi:Protein of unknown function (DUF2281)